VSRSKSSGPSRPTARPRPRPPSPAVPTLGRLLHAPCWLWLRCDAYGHSGATKRTAAIAPTAAGSTAITAKLGARPAVLRARLPRTPHSCERPQFTSKLPDGDFLLQAQVVCFGPEAATQRTTPMSSARIIERKGSGVHAPGLNETTPAGVTVVLSGAVQTPPSKI
jgi:hypothetical protein